MRKRIHETLPSKKRRKFSTDSKPFKASLLVQKEANSLDLKLVSKQEAALKAGCKVNFETHLCNMPLQLTVNKGDTLQYLHSMLERNLCREYKTFLVDEKVEISHNQAKTPVTISVHKVILPTQD